MATVGLILEGGGMRGAYTGGVLDALLKMGIHFKDVIGVSAGAAHAISYISEQFGRNKEIYKKFVPKKEYLSIRNFFKTGSLFGMKYVFYEVTRKLLPFNYDAFSESDQKLTAVATDYETGEPFYKEIGDINDDNEMLYLCASAAIPMASTVVNVDGKRLMDGGASDSIPIEYSIKKGNKKNVIVVTRNRGYKSHKSILSNVVYMRYPFNRRFAHTVANRFTYYNKSLDILREHEQAGDALIFYPSRPLEVDRFEKDPKKMCDLYQNGYDDVMAQKDRLLNFLSDCDNVRYS